MQAHLDDFFEFRPRGRIVARHEIDGAAFDPAFQAAHLLGMRRCSFAMTVNLPESSGSSPPGPPRLSTRQETRP